MYVPECPPPATASLVPFAGHMPVVGPCIMMAPSARIIGRARVGARCTLGQRATVRGDGETIEIGDDCWFGDGATVHIVHRAVGTRIGPGATVGSRAVVHAAEVGDGAVIGRRSVVLDRATVGPGAFIAPGAVVTPGKVVAAGMLYAGAPAVPVRPISTDELQRCHQDERQPSPKLGTVPGPAHGLLSEHPTGVLVCDTVEAQGAIRLGPGANIWFGTQIVNPVGRITIGARSNIQDNTMIVIEGEASLEIGAGATIGHNATLEAARLGDEALVGIGAHVARGTIIEPRACLAAGAVTEPGAVIRAGTLAAGRPARMVRALSNEEQRAFARIADIYSDEYLPIYAATALRSN